MAKIADVRKCLCGCGQLAKVYRSATGLNKGWRAYASGHAPNERLLISVPESAIDLAYLAGIIDGEGCIYARVYLYKNCLNTIISLSVNMNSAGVIHWIHHTVGGEVYSDTAPSRRAELFHWQIRGRKIVPILQALLPYLKEKKRRAELAIELASLISHAKSGGKRQIAEAEWEERMRIASQIKAFNQNPAGETSVQ